MERKTPTSIRLTQEARRLLRLLAVRLGVSQAAVLELFIRQKARDEQLNLPRLKPGEVQGPQDLDDFNPNQQTTTMHPASLRLLRQIAQHTGEKQVAVLHRLLAREWQQLHTKGSHVPHATP